MTLDYKIARIDSRDDTWKGRGYCLITVDSNGIGRSIRKNEGQPQRKNETLIRYSKVGSVLAIGAESYFFQEGQAEKYSKAKFGGLSLDDKGNCVLSGLYDEEKALIK
jgi:uncharacterized membrane-anchored protein